jgi:hypothetical protein
MEEHPIEDRPLGMPRQETKIARKEKSVTILPARLSFW